MIKGINIGGWVNKYKNQMLFFLMRIISCIMFVLIEKLWKCMKILYSVVRAFFVLFKKININ